MAVNEGIQVFAQDYISSGIAQNFWLRDPLLYMLAGLGGNNSKPTGLEIGRPSGAQVFSGVKMSSIERKALTGANAYKPRFQLNFPSNGKILGLRDIQPTVANATTQSHDQLSGTAEVRWTGVMSEPILIWKDALDRALKDAGMSKQGRGLARAQVTKEAVDTATQQIYETISTELWTGFPDDQDVDPWNHFIGLGGWIGSATNYCARVDRAASKNAQWRPNVDTTTNNFDIANMIDMANIDYGLADKGEGAMLCFVNNAQYKAAKSQVKGKGGVELLNGMPDIAHMGMKREILKIDNCYVVRAKKCPASTTYFIDPRQVKFMTSPDNTFKVTPFRNLWEYQEGGKRAMQAFVETQAMLAFDNPGLNVAFTAITDPT